MRRTAIAFGRLLAAQALTVLSVMMAPGVCAAHVGTLRPLASGLTAFQSDGTGYAAWQVAGSQDITVLDVRQGYEHLVPLLAGCSLMTRGFLGEISIGAGHVMLGCGPGKQAALQVQTGATVNLSRGAGARYEWISTGRLYAESRPTCGDGSCIALENLRTGSISLRRRVALYDLNRANAPTLGVCPPLRGRLSRALQIAEPGYFAFANGVLGLPNKSDEGVELARCSRRSLILQRGVMPRDFQLGSGVLTWDIGYPLRESAPEEALPGPATLNSYQLLDGSHHQWRLPNTTVSGIGEGPQPYGYSAHAGNAVFWIAATSVFGGEAGIGLDQSTVYEARL